MQIQRQLPIFNPWFIRLPPSEQAEHLRSFSMDTVVRKLSLVLLSLLAALTVSCNSQNSAPARPPNAQENGAAFEGRGRCDTLFICDSFTLSESMPYLRITQRVGLMIVLVTSKGVAYWMIDALL
jgi:hypothetical protein